GINQYTESRELIQWMRDYNGTAASAGHRKVHLYGIDLPAGARLGGARLAINSALAYLSKADPAAAQRLQPDTLPAADVGEFGSLSAAAQAEFETRINTIAQALQKNRKTLLAHSSDEDFRWAVHNLETARQFAKCLPMTPPPGATDRNAWNGWVV